MIFDAVRLVRGALFCLGLVLARDRGLSLNGGRLEAPAIVGIGPRHGRRGDEKAARRVLRMTAVGVWDAGRSRPAPAAAREDRRFEGE